MMNSDFVAERAQNLAKQVESLEPAARVQSLYLRVLNRPAEPREIDAGLSYIEGFQKRGKSAADAWASFGRVLLASNEYMYLD